MGMPAQETEWTAEMARALPDDGKRREVLDGELVVTPAPSWDHQSVVEQLYLLLAPYVRAHRIGVAKLSPAEIEFATRRLVQPDLFVVPWRGDTPPHHWQDVGALLLVVEVLSPSTARADRTRKRVIYQDERVPEYWIVDPDARLVERWRPDEARPEVIADTLTWQPAGAVEPLVISLAGFFAGILR
jgi:Uma2 family endonuclease